MTSRKCPDPAEEKTHTQADVTLRQGSTTGFPLFCHLIWSPNQTVPTGLFFHQHSQDLGPGWRTRCGVQELLSKSDGENRGFLLV